MNDKNESQLGEHGAPASESISRPENAGRIESGQFRISTILVWMLIVCTYLVTFNVSDAFGGEHLQFEELFFEVCFVLLLFTPASTCIPYLIDRLLNKTGGLIFSGFWIFWMTICVGVYSFLMLMLATTAFTPDWKGSKGSHWTFYLLDDWAGMTLWPIYLVAVGFFCVAISSSRKAETYPGFTISTFILAGISFWYTFATLFLNFADRERLFWIVPGSVCICYSLYTAILIKNRTWQWRDLLRSYAGLLTWAFSLLASIALKIPLAFDFYHKLADEPPEGCFVVTASAKGHPWIVGSWLDTKTSQTVNQQLFNFYEFENWLKRRMPGFHRRLRRVYNTVGPVVARMIVFKWQADIVYWLLKPIEWLAKLICRI